jgi:hypothetical protein
MPAQPKVTLIDLPEELLAHVISHVEWEDVPSLMKTCRRMLRSARPSLYETVFSKEKGDPERLLRSIANDPQLGSHLKGVSRSSKPAFESLLLS